MRLRGHGESWPFGIAGPCGGEGGTKCCHRLGNLGLSADTPAGPGGLGGGRERRGSRVSRLPFLTRRLRGQPGSGQGSEPIAGSEGEPNASWSRWAPDSSPPHRCPHSSARSACSLRPPAPCTHAVPHLERRLPAPLGPRCSGTFSAKQDPSPPSLPLPPPARPSLPACLSQTTLGRAARTAPHTQSEPQVRDSKSRLSLTGQGPERLLGLRLPFCKMEPTTQLTVMSQHPARWMSPHCLGPPLPLPTSQAPRSRLKPDTHVAKVSLPWHTPPR